MWTRLTRDVLCPLVGLAIEVHEVALAAEPRELAVLAGLLLIGVPIDAAARLLALRQLPQQPDSSPPTQPSVPS